MRKTEAENEAKAWMERHAMLLSPEELPFEEERLAEALLMREGFWPVPRPVQHMGVFAAISDAASFNRIVGDPENWRVILDRFDLFHSWITPQAAVLFGRPWFNRIQWRDHIRRGVPFSLFSADERRTAKEKGIALSDTPAGRTLVYRIVTRIEHAMEMYLSGGGRSKVDGGLKQPGGYIIESIANDCIQSAGADAGFQLTRVRTCPNCLSMRRGRARRSEVVHVIGHVYRCERCSDTARNLDLAVARARVDGGPVPAALLAERERVGHFVEFSGVTCVCPNNECRGRFVPLSCVHSPEWWDTGAGIAARGAMARLRSFKGVQRFRDPPDAVADMPLACPACGRRFTPREALRTPSGFRGQSGKLTGLPSMFTWTRPETCTLDRHQNGNAGHCSLKETLVDSAIQDPSWRIGANQRIRVLVGELAIHAARIGRATAPAILTHCFCEGAADWMLRHPEDASRYFFESLSAQEGNAKRKTHVAKGQEAAIHQTVLAAWLSRICGRLTEIRRIKGSRMRALEDLKWFCRPPAYNGGPRSSFTGIVEDDFRVRNRSAVAPVGTAPDRPRLAWIVSLRRADADGKATGPELSEHVSFLEWQTIGISEESGLVPGDSVSVVALVMPGHHCHAPIQRIIRLRTSLLSPIIGRIRSEEAGGVVDQEFWRDWQKRAEEARKSTGIGI